MLLLCQCYGLSVTSSIKLKLLPYSSSYTFYDDCSGKKERKKERKTCLTPTRPDVTGLDHVLYESFSINKPSPENKYSGFKKAPGRQNKQFIDGKHVSPRGDLTYRALPTPSVVLAKTALACPEHVTTCFQRIRRDGPELHPLT